MNFDDFENRICAYLERIHIELDDKKIMQFYKYMNLLIEWNKKINLTTIINPEDIIVKHFVDSVMISNYIKKDLKVVDIGTGAGFPGIPLKIVRDDIEIVLVDALNKRVNFLNEVVKILKEKYNI